MTWLLITSALVALLAGNLLWLAWNRPAWLVQDLPDHPLPALDRIRLQQLAERERKHVVDVGALSLAQRWGLVNFWQCEQQDREPPVILLRTALSALGYADLTTPLWKVPEHQRWPDAQDIVNIENLFSLHYSRSRREFYFLDREMTCH